MCGITGYILKVGKGDHSIDVLKKMMTLQKHRGPNDCGIAIIDRIDGKVELDIDANSKCQPNQLYFGFNRLSILDLSENGHQPMYNEEAGVVFMLNGEIYNAFDYKAELSEKGYSFRSTTDTEIALNLFLEYGIDGMIKRLNGMFAIAIYDSREKRMYLVRDRFGIKPLYVLNDERYLAFSSEVKSFTKLPGFHLEFDDSNFSEFLLFRNLINRTLYKNVINIEPGTYWTIDSENVIVKIRYYDINIEGTQDFHESQGLSEKLEYYLRTGVKRQMISDVKLGCQLSGGVDSSLVTYYANEFVPKGSLDTISIIPDEKGFSEEEYMDVVINNLGLNSHKYSLDSYYYFGKIEEATWHFEHPLNHPNTIGIYQLSQCARDHVTVLLSGEGADEVLAGYDRFLYFISFQKRMRYLLTQVKRNKANLSSFLPIILTGNAQMILASSFTSFGAISSIYPTFNFFDATNHRLNLLEGLTGGTLIKQRKYEILTYLPDLLMRQDKMSMAHSIENRVPFLDNEFVSFALNLTQNSLVGKEKLVTKSILKDIAAKKFTREFAFRRKRGFGIPLKKFFKSNDFNERWKDVWMNDIRQLGLFNYKVLDSWLGNIDRCKNDQLDVIWLSVCFNLWHKQYIQ